jgi:signal recognition particle receptor subunit beta
MGFANSEQSVAAPDIVAIKVLVAGGFGVGKTTLVGSVSEIPPLRTEEVLTETGVGVDDLAGLERKTTTTVALDFGRITINPELILYLFGTPGQERYWFLWDDLARGALGAVVLVDTRRLRDCFSAIDFFERRQIPFAIGLNCFHGIQEYDVDEVRHALSVDAGVPILLCDARSRESNKDLLVALIQHIMAALRPSDAPVRG